MAKVIWSIADSPDDPIFNNEFVVSSNNLNPESTRLKKSSTQNMGGNQTDPSTLSIDKNESYRRLK